MQNTIRNLYGLMPPAELPSSCIVKGQPETEIYHKCATPVDRSWREIEPFKVCAHTSNAEEIWLDFMHRENRIWLNGKELHPAESLKMRNHSPDGFNWGYGGSGPGQSALAICLELYGAALADRIYQNFKWEFVANWRIDHAFEVELDLSGFNARYVIPVMEALKNELQKQLDRAKADLEFLEWLPRNAENLSNEPIGPLTHEGREMTEEEKRIWAALQRGEYEKGTLHANFSSKDQRDEYALKFGIWDGPACYVHVKIKDGSEYFFAVSRISLLEERKAQPIKTITNGQE